MRLRFLGSLLLFITLLASGQQEKKEPDAINFSGSTVESPFFKFHYSFPQGWSPANDQLRMEKNQHTYEEATKRVKDESSHVVNAGTTTTKVFWVYELFLATPEPLSDGGKRPLPYIRIWAMERSNMIDKAGDNAKLLAKTSNSAHPITVLHDPKEVVISRHKFVRSDLIFQPNHYEALFDTKAGKYLLFFEFHGKNEQEINELAKTIESIKLD